MSLLTVSAIGPAPNKLDGNECLPAVLRARRARSCQRPSASVRILLIALLSLLLGVLVYITARAPGTTGFLPASWSIAIPWSPAAMTLAGSLPTLFHTLGFCLLLSLIAGAGRRTTAWVCTFWLSVELLFEAGQYSLLGAWITEHLASWFSHTWLLAHIGPYFAAGVFDPFDLIAATTGALLALVLVAVNSPERKHHHD